VSGRSKNPKRVAAGRRNRQRRGVLTERGREQLRAAAYRVRPWQYATGPRTAAGKRQAAANGRQRQRGGKSVRELRGELAGTEAMIKRMVDLRK
jgi:hypothetical protein